MWAKDNVECSVDVNELIDIARDRIPPFFNESHYVISVNILIPDSYRYRFSQRCQWFLMLQYSILIRYGI